MDTSSVHSSNTKVKFVLQIFLYLPMLFFKKFLLFLLQQEDRAELFQVKEERTELKPWDDADGKYKSSPVYSPTLFLQSLAIYSGKPVLGTRIYSCPSAERHHR